MGVPVRRMAGSGLGAAAARGRGLRCHAGIGGDGTIDQLRQSHAAFDRGVVGEVQFHPVLAPGDRAHKVRAQSEKRGVYLDDGLWEDLQKLSAESKKEKQ